MITHDHIWNVWDTVAKMKNTSRSGLCTRAVLDPTLLNQSKQRLNNAPRWYTMRTLCAILNAIGMSMEEFGRLVDAEVKKDEKNAKRK